MNSQYVIKYRSQLSLGLLLVAGILLAVSENGFSGGHDASRVHAKGIAVNPELLKGIHLIYERAFDPAEQLFKEIIASHPVEPAGYFYLAMVSWSRLAAGFWYPDVVKEFKQRIDRTIEVAQARVNQKAADSYDYFYLGGALGFKGRFELMKGNWLSSFLLASDAIEALNICLKMDPANKDVLLGIGTFDYYTARLSGVLKFLTYLLLHKGDKAEGLRKLNIAAKEAVYSVTEAKSVLLHIYLFLEQDFDKALVFSNDLAAEYPENPRFTVLKGVSCIR